MKSAFCEDWEEPSVSAEVRSWGGRVDKIKVDASVPRVIWSYWHDSDVPDLISACRKSWEENCPGFDVRMLNDKNVSTYVGAIPRWVARKNHAAVSDWIRLKLLSTYGGIWIDASFFIFKNIESMLPCGVMSSADPFAFFNRKWSTSENMPMIESWFILAPKGHPTISKWLREYSIACLSRKAYRVIMGHIYGMENIFQMYPNVGYYTVFASLQVVLRRNSELKFMISDSESGPYALSRRLGYNDESIARHLTSREITEGWVKLSSGSRKATMDRISGHGASEKSSVFKYISP